MKYVELPKVNKMHCSMIEALDRVRNGKYIERTISYSHELLGASNELHLGTFKVDVNFQKEEEEFFKEHPEYEDNYIDSLRILVKTKNPDSLKDYGSHSLGKHKQDLTGLYAFYLNPTDKNKGPLYICIFTFDKDGCLILLKIGHHTEYDYPRNKYRVIDPKRHDETRKRNSSITRHR